MEPGHGRTLDWIQRNRWIWSLLGVVLLWLVLSVITSRFSLQSLSGVAISASFLALAGLGQMFVITAGRGNIDLSIPNVLTLSAYLSAILIKGNDGNLWMGVLVAIAIGLSVGVVNAVLVLAFRIPAIIATLATGYILATANLFANRALVSYGVSPTLKWLTTAKLGALPVVAIVAVIAVLGASLVLGKLVYGRTLSAVGQNSRAAYLAGLRVTRIVAATFVISAMLAAIDGLLLQAYVGGAFLGMGSPYLLQSLGAVVLGGSLIMGGASTALGTLFGCLLLVLIVATMQVAGLPSGMQDIVQGVVVILVLSLAGGVKGRRVRKAAPKPAQESA
ncbi:ABC transporter permease [Acidisoma sp. 7E03]